MTVLILSVLVTNQPVLSPWRLLLNNEGYALRKQFSHRGFYVEEYVSDSRTEKISIEIRPVNSNHSINERWQSFARFFARQSEDVTVVPSRFELGNRCYFDVGDAGTSLANIYSTYVDIRMRTRRGASRGANGAAQFEKGWGEAEAKLWESVARWVLAEWSPKSMTSQNQTVGGHTISGLRTRDNLRLGNVRQLALKKGWNYRLNEETGFATVTAGNRTIVLPLGSPKIKVGNEMRDLGQIVVAVNKEPYVPITELARW
jgi:hypothetical protein